MVSLVGYSVSQRIIAENQRLARLVAPTTRFVDTDYREAAGLGAFACAEATAGNPAQRCITVQPVGR